MWLYVSLTQADAKHMQNACNPTVNRIVQLKYMHYMDTNNIKKKKTIAFGRPLMWSLFIYHFYYKFLHSCKRKKRDIAHSRIHIRIRIRIHIMIKCLQAKMNGHCSVQ